MIASKVKLPCVSIRVFLTAHVDIERVENYEYRVIADLPDYVDNLFGLPLVIKFERQIMKYDINVFRVRLVHLTP